MYFMKGDITLLVATSYDIADFKWLLTSYFDLQMSMPSMILFPVPRQGRGTNVMPQRDLFVKGTGQAQMMGLLSLTTLVLPCSQYSSVLPWRVGQMSCIM